MTNKNSIFIENRLKPNQIFLRVINFLREIGLTVAIRELESWEQEQSFFPNVFLNNGSIAIDPAALVGDLLHEAGHLAIFPSRLRPYCNNNTISDLEAMLNAASIAGLQVTDTELNILQYCYDDQAPQGWQYAANIQLGLDSRTGFDIRLASIEEGKNVHDSISASIGSPFGHRTSVTLYYLGLTTSKSSFPKLKQWLSD